MQKMRLLKPFLYAVILSSLSWLACEQSTEPQKTAGAISGTVKSENGIPVQAFIFVEDSLVCSTENGEFAITSLEQGSYQLMCSALGFRDSTFRVNVLGGNTVSMQISLTPDSLTGRVYAEFQDVFLFQQQLAQDSTLLHWDDQQMWDGVTGATLQSKTLRRQLPPREVFLGDSLVALTDDFGQCWFELQRGTYPFTAKCEGYEDTTRIIKIAANERMYAIFFLNRTSTLF